MTLSVIIPCYNGAKYLGACLDTVLAQSVEDMEVIVIDDGSADDSFALAKRYAQKDSRVLALHQQNAGVSAARNLGLSRASGEWVTFVDSDDLLTPDAFSVMLGAADESVDLVVCAHETFDESGNRSVFYPQTRWMDKRGEAQKKAAALRLIEGDSVLNIMCNKLHRRALLSREGIVLCNGLKIAEDALFNLEAVLCGQRIAYVNRVTYRYRMHGASATNTRVTSEYDAHKQWLLALRSLLERRGCMERYYPAYVDSVVLRLYKDGGVLGAMRAFSEKARPLLLRGGMQLEKMSLPSRLLLLLCESGAYAAAYALIAPVQMVSRKIGELRAMMCAKKEKPQ